jgi:hypothetical protein
MVTHLYHRRRYWGEHKALGLCQAGMHRSPGYERCGQPRRAAVCAFPQTRADYAARQGPSHLRELIADSERLMKQVGQAAGSRRSFSIVRVAVVTEYDSHGAAGCLRMWPGPVVSGVPLA